MDGHPASSKWTLFEVFARNIIELAQNNREQWAETAILITVDEGCGYYDSGFIETVDFFGTGLRFHPSRSAAISATFIASIPPS
jgi:phospholipase C